MSVWQLLFPKFVCPGCGGKLESSDIPAPEKGDSSLEIMDVLILFLTGASIFPLRKYHYWCDQCKRIVRRDEVAMAPPHSQ